MDRIGGSKDCLHRARQPEGERLHRKNARLRDELLNGEIFYALLEARIVIESWRRDYNAIHPHASIDYEPPASEVFVPAFAECQLRFIDQLRRPR